MAVATAVAIGGLALSAASATNSFIQAKKQRDLQKQAEADADKAMAEARKRLDLNFYRELGIQKEPYELAREAQLVTAADAMRAAQESGRNVGATAGAIQMANVAAQAEVRNAMGEEQRNIQEMVVDEESRLRDVQAQLDLEEAAGAQQAAADAQRARAQFVTEGMEAATTAAQQGLNLIPMFAGSKVPTAAEIEALYKDNPELFKAGIDPRVPGYTGKTLNRESLRVAQRLYGTNPEIFSFNPMQIRPNQK